MLRTRRTLVLLVTLLATLAGGAGAAAPAPNLAALAAGESSLAVTQAQREILSQSAEQALARLGRSGGFSADPRVRIGMPPALRDTEQLLRRLGGDRETEAFILAMNQTAEAMLARVAPLVMAAIREADDVQPESLTAGRALPLAGGFRRLHGEALRARLVPIARELTEGQLIARAYQRVVKQSTRYGFLRGTAPKLEDYLAQQALNGLITAMTEAERVLQAKRTTLNLAGPPDPAGRSPLPS